MHRLLYCFFLFIVLFFSACKKDLLHWQKIQQINSNTTSRLSRIRFINDSLCIIAGGVKFAQSEVLRSVDGGYTWTNYSSSAAPKGMYGLSVAPDGTIYLCGIDGDILSSKDSGKTWQFNRIWNWLSYVGVSFPTNDTGVFVDNIAQDTGHIIQTDANFNIIDQYEFFFGLNDLYMVSPSTGYVIGYGAVMKTTDFRRSWFFQDVKGDNFTAMDIHGDEMWLCGYNGCIFHTSNGGNHWDRLRNGNDITLPHYHLYSIIFKDSQHGWAAGEGGKLIYTDDAGHHWEEYDHFTNSTIRNIAICPNGDLLVAGDNGALFRIVSK